MYYRLGTQTIVDLARGVPNSAARWIKRKDGVISARDIKVSTMSWAAIEIEFKTMERKTGRLHPSEAIFRVRIDRVFDKYRSMGSVLPIDDKAVQIWVKYLQQHEIEYSGFDGAMLQVGLEEKMVLATAIAGFRDVPITLVTRRETAHDQFHILGLRIEDPDDD